MLTEVQLQEYFAYLRFRSISADPACAPEMTACAEWLREKFARMGFTAQLQPIAGPPVVVAKHLVSPTAKTVLIYGHYDVQPVDPLALWRHPPFEPVVQDGLVFARGAPWWK